MSPKKSKSNSKKKLRKRVLFEFFAPQAEQVGVASSFNDWDASKTLLKREKNGKWRAEILLSPGRYQYRYLVDGDWQNDQRPVECIPNEFGTWNCVIEVK